MLSNQAVESSTTIETEEEKLDALAVPISEHIQETGEFPDFNNSGFEDYNLYLSACIFLLRSGFFSRYENYDAIIQLDFDLSKMINLSVFDELIVALNSGNCPSNSISSFNINFAGYLHKNDKNKSYVEVGFDDETGTVFSINSEVTNKIRDVFHRGLGSSTSAEGITFSLSNYILNPETIETLGLVLASPNAARGLFLMIHEEREDISSKFSYEKNWQADERFYNRYDSLAKKINAINVYRQSSLFDRYHENDLMIDITSATLNMDSFHQKLSRNLSDTIRVYLQFKPNQDYFTTFGKPIFEPGQHTESLKEHRKNLANAQQFLMNDNSNNSSLTESNIADIKETNNINNSNSNDINYAGECQDILFPNGKRKRQAITQDTQNNAAASNKPKHDSEKSQHKL